MIYKNIVTLERNDIFVGSYITEAYANTIIKI